MKPLFKLGTLRKAKLILEKSIEDFLQREFGISLSYSEYLLLFHINKSQGATQYALAKKMAVSPPMVSRMIGNLDYFNLIQIEVTEAKGMKKTQINLSEKGVALVTSSEKWVEESISKGDLHSLAKLEEGLRRINSLL